MKLKLSSLFKYYQHRKFWLLLIPVLLCFLDAWVTVLGQPDRYWESGFEVVNEANPSARMAMGVSPMAFALERLIYTIAFGAAILLLPPRLALFLSLWISVTHTTGVFSWVYPVFRWSYFQVMGFLFVVSLVLFVSWLFSGYVSVRSPRPRDSGRPE